MINTKARRLKIIPAPFSFHRIPEQHNQQHGVLSLEGWNLYVVLLHYLPLLGLTFFFGVGRFVLISLISYSIEEG